MQAALEESLEAVTGEPARVVGAGRTDAGVHATAQVAHVDIGWARSTTELQRAWNALLPRDVAVRDLGIAPFGFHARHSAEARAYEYAILAQAVRAPLTRRTTFHVPAALDHEAMGAAARRLVGQRDFGGFGKPMTRGGPTVRRMEEACVTRHGAEIRIALTANAFLRHQVRRTVGLLVDIGRGREEAGAVDAVLARTPGAPVPWRAPAQGLVLAGVRYPSDEDIERRARSRRDAEAEERREQRT